MQVLIYLERRGVTAIGVVILTLVMLHGLRFVQGWLA